MSQNLSRVFEIFKETDYYHQIDSPIDLSWLKDKLSIDELEELERQFYCLILDYEEELFINAARYGTQIILELFSREL